MTPKDFFTIVLRILALLIIFNGIIPAIANAFSWFNYDASTAFVLFGFSLLFIALIAIILFKSDRIIKIMSLDKGFDSDRFELNASNPSIIVEVASALIGLYMAFSELPYLLLELFKYFRLEVSHSGSMFGPEFNNTDYIYQSILTLIIGLVIVASRKKIAGLFVNKNN
ncbi:MAG: hypothetical protein ACWA5P_06035 [bacterium]